MGVNASARMVVKVFYGEHSLNVKDIIEKALLKYIEREVADDETHKVDLSPKKNL